MCVCVCVCVCYYQDNMWLKNVVPDSHYFSHLSSDALAFFHQLTKTETLIKNSTTLITFLQIKMKGIVDNAFSKSLRFFLIRTHGAFFLGLRDRTSWASPDHTFSLKFLNLRGIRELKYLL